MWSLGELFQGQNEVKLRTERVKDRIISLGEVSLHDSANDCWIVLFNEVYDVTKFLHLHPGGAEVLMENGGRDATISFQEAGHTNVSLEMMKPYRLGNLPEHEHMNLELVLGSNWKTSWLSV